jgi:hypothetical protein
VVSEGLVEYRNGIERFQWGIGVVSDIEVVLGVWCGIALTSNEVQVVSKRNTMALDGWQNLTDDTAIASSNFMYFSKASKKGIL